MATDLDSATGIISLLRTEAEKVERLGKLSEKVVDAISNIAGFSLQVSPAYGGPGLTPVPYLEMIESLSYGDASSGWCAMVSSESSACVNANLDPAIVREILGPDGREVVCLSAVGSGQALIEGDNYTLTGHWRFVSGCHHARWFCGMCPVYDKSGPKLKEGGAPLMRMFVVPMSRAVIENTWNVSGLKATGSDDVVIDNVTVPAAFTFDLSGTPTDPALNWRFPAGLRFAMSKAAAASGMARAIFDTVIPLLDRAPFAGAGPAADEARVHVQLADALAALEGGRALLYRNVATAYEQIESGDDLDVAAIAKVRLAVVFAARQAELSGRLASELAGTGALFNPVVDRFIRDLNVARHHLQLQAHIREDIGRVLLGRVPKNPMF